MFKKKIVLSVIVLIPITALVIGIWRFQRSSEGVSAAAEAVSQGSDVRHVEKKYSELKKTDVVVRVDDRVLTAGELAAQARFRAWVLTNVNKRKLNSSSRERVIERLAQDFIQRFVFVSLWDLAAIHAKFDNFEDFVQHERILSEKSGIEQKKLYQTLESACGLSERKARQWLMAETRATAYQTYCATSGVVVSDAEIVDYTNNLAEICHVCALSNNVMKAALTQALDDLAKKVDFGLVQSNFLAATHSGFPIRWGTFSYDELTECCASGKILAAWAFSAPIGSTSPMFYELDDSRAIIRIADRTCKKSVFESLDSNALSEDTVTLERLAVRVWDAPPLVSAEEAKKILRESKVAEARKNLTVELIKKANVEYPQGTQLW